MNNSSVLYIIYFNKLGMENYIIMSVYCSSGKNSHFLIGTSEHEFIIICFEIVPF